MQMTFEGRWNTVVEGLHDLIGRCMELEVQAIELGGLQSADQISAIRRSLVAALLPLEDLFGTPAHRQPIARRDSARRARALVSTSSHTSSPGLL